MADALGPRVGPHHRVPVDLPYAIGGGVMLRWSVDRPIVPVVTSGAALALAATVTAAQAPDRDSEFRGRVTDTSGEPILGSRSTVCGRWALIPPHVPRRLETSC
jgi:hypothetical protein